MEPKEVQAALELCREIEKLPAGEQQTKVSIMASDLYNSLKQHTPQELKELTGLDLEIVKQNLERLLEDPTVGPKLKAIAIEATDHLIKAVELFPNQDLRTIPISTEVYLQYDEHDTWFAITDRDNAHYDDMGSVVMTYDELDDLIKAVTKLRGKIRFKGVDNAEFYRQFGLYEAALSDVSNNQLIMVALSLVLQEIGQNPFINAIVTQLQARGGYSPIDVSEKGEEEAEDA